MENIIDGMKKALNSNYKKLEKLQELFILGTKSMHESNYERNAINELMNISNLKAEIREQEMWLAIHKMGKRK